MAEGEAQARAYHTCQGPYPARGPTLPASLDFALCVAYGAGQVLTLGFALCVAYGAGQVPTLTLTR